MMSSMYTKAERSSTGDKTRSVLNTILYKSLSEEEFGCCKPKSKRQRKGTRNGQFFRKNNIENKSNIKKLNDVQSKTNVQELSSKKCIKHGRNLTLKNMNFSEAYDKIIKKNKYIGPLGIYQRRSMITFRFCLLLPI